MEREEQGASSDEDHHQDQPMQDNEENQPQAEGLQLEFEIEDALREQENQEENQEAPGLLRDLRFEIMLAVLVHYENMMRDIRELFRMAMREEAGPRNENNQDQEGGGNQEPGSGNEPGNDGVGPEG